MKRKILSGIGIVVVIIGLVIVSRYGREDQQDTQAETQVSQSDKPKFHTKKPKTDEPHSQKPDKPKQDEPKPTKSRITITSPKIEKKYPNGGTIEIEWGVRPKGSKAEFTPLKDAFDEETQENFKKLFAIIEKMVT